MITNEKNIFQNQERRLRITKWIVLGMTSGLVSLILVFNYFYLGMPLEKGVVNGLAGIAITIVMVNLAFGYTTRLRRQLLEAIESRKMAEEELKLRGLALESAANAIVISDKNGRITWVNSAFTQLTGYSPDEVIGGNPRILKSGKHDDAFFSRLWQTILNGKVWQGEIVNKRKDGSLYIEEQTITPVLDGQNQIRQFIGIKQDITQRKQAEEREQDQRGLAQALYEAGNILSASLDLEDVLDRLLQQIGQVVPCDAVNLMTIEQSQARVTHVYGYDQISPEIGQLVRNSVFNLSETANLQYIVENQQPFVIPDVAKYDGWNYREATDYIHSWVGVPIIVQDTVVALLALDKREPSYYQQEHTKLLEMFAAQVALAWHNALLFEETRSRARELDLLNRIIVGTTSAKSKAELLRIGCVELAHFFSVAQTIAVLLDETQTNIVVVAEHLNPDLPSLLGRQLSVDNNPPLSFFFKEAEPIVMADIRLMPLPPQMKEMLTNRGIVAVLMVPVFLRERVVGAIGIHSCEPREFTATEIHMIQTVGEELGQSMEVVRLNDQLRTHAVELENRVVERTRELAEANEQLQELDRLKSKFVSDVSHELRTPMTNLGMYLDLLEYGKAEKRSHYLNILKKEMSRLHLLVEDILNLSRLEMSRERGVDFEIIDLNQIIEQVVAAHLPRTDAAGIKLKFLPDLDQPSILGMRNQLAQVITNLLTNAINYTEEGWIQVSTKRENGQVCLQVQDSGLGIEPEDMPHLFERFYRGQKIGQLGIPGTGLGLGIVQEIVDLHGGRIDVVSEVGSGSTFYVWLPLSDSDQQ